MMSFLRLKNRSAENDILNLKKIKCSNHSKTGSSVKRYENLRFHRSWNTYNNNMMMTIILRSMDRDGHIRRRSLDTACLSMLINMYLILQTQTRGMTLS